MCVTHRFKRIRRTSKLVGFVPRLMIRRGTGEPYSNHSAWVQPNLTVTSP